MITNQKNKVSKGESLGTKAERITNIRNALAIILRASFNTIQKDRLEDMVRLVGKIDKLLPHIKEKKRMVPCLEVGYYLCKLKDKWVKVQVLYHMVKEKRRVRYLIWDGLQWWESKRLPMYGKKN